MAAKSIVARGRFTVRCDSCRWEYSSDVRQTRQHHDRLKADHNEIFHPDGRDISDREAITRMMATFPHEEAS